MPINWPNAARAPAIAPNKLLPAVQKQADAAATKGFEYGGLKDGFEYGGKGSTQGFEIEDRKGSTQGFDIEQRKAKAGFEYGGLATPKK